MLREKNKHLKLLNEIVFGPASATVTGPWPCRHGLRKAGTLPLSYTRITVYSTGCYELTPPTSFFPSYQSSDAFSGGASWGCRTRNFGAAPDRGYSRPAAPRRAGPSSGGRTGRTSGPTGGPLAVIAPDTGEAAGVSRRTVARDLDFLRDEESTPLEYDEARHASG